MYLYDMPSDSDNKQIVLYQNMNAIAVCLQVDFKILPVAKNGHSVHL